MKNQTLYNIAYIIGLAALVVVALGFPLMIVWNWVMPDIFGLPEITFWQAIGLNFLSVILIKPTIKVNKD
jgi:hypothetical protein